MMLPLAAPHARPVCARRAQRRASVAVRAVPHGPALARRARAQTRLAAAPQNPPAEPGAADAAAAAAAEAESSGEPGATNGDGAPASAQMPRSKARAALGKGVNLFDPAATLSRFLTRRFGIVGGLALVAVLATTEGAAIITALQEEFTPTAPVSGELVTLPSGVSYKDIKLGGGAIPSKGDFVGMHLRVTSVPDAAGGAEPVVYLDTRASGRKPIAFNYRSALRPPVCAGLEMGLAGMKRGGARVIDVPAALGPYAGADPSLQGPPLAPGMPRLPVAAALRYEVTLEEVSPSYI